MYDRLFKEDTIAIEKNTLRFKKFSFKKNIFNFKIKFKIKKIFNKT